MARFRMLVAVAAALALTLVPAAASAKVRIVASINDLASIASTVGGDQVETFSIARPTADIHRVEVLPSYMVRVARANLYLKVGLGLDAWADGVIAGSRNSRLSVVNCSRDVRVLEKPAGKISAAMGDIHPDGNPHYWLDPRHGAVVARTIAEALAQADPAHAAEFRARAESFARECERTWESGRAAAGALPSKTLLTYHRSWSYFVEAFGLDVAGNVEPVPGIPPTARHLAELVQIVKARHVGVLLQEPYFSPDAGRFLAREGGLRVVVAAPSCDSPAAGSYLAHFSGLLQRLGESG
jgi:zinc/manganese transport system substrate-binding protein